MFKCSFFSVIKIFRFNERFQWWKFSRKALINQIIFQIFKGTFFTQKNLFIRRKLRSKAVWVSITNKYYDRYGLVEAIRNKRARYYMRFEWTTPEHKENKNTVKIYKAITIQLHILKAKPFNVPWGQKK